MKAWIAALCLLIFTLILFSDSEDDNTPPLPSINLDYYQDMGLLVAWWFSDSTFDRPVVYEFQVWDPVNEFWFKPFAEDLSAPPGEWMRVWIYFRGPAGNVSLRNAMARVKVKWAE